MPRMRVSSAFWRSMASTSFDHRLGFDGRFVVYLSVSSTGGVDEFLELPCSCEGDEASTAAIMAGAGVSFGVWTLAASPLITWLVRSEEDRGTRDGINPVRFAAGMITPGRTSGLLKVT